jgi:G6PDH family F420-dependent oxidoreductase
MEIHYNVFGCFREPAADIDLAERAVEAGFEGVWIGDHFLPWIDSRPYTHQILPWLGSLMATVPDVTVGTSVTCPLYRYEPGILAQAVATLDNMYPGRFELGVGTGEALNEAPFVDDWPDWETRASMLVEAIECMRTLWETPEYHSFEGEHYGFEDVRLFTEPRTEVDISWAGWGPQSCAMAGEHAGNLISFSPPERFAEYMIPRFETGLERAGRSPEEATVSTEYFTAYGDTDDLVDEVRERGEYIPHDTELDNPDPRDIQAVADEELAAMSDAEIADELGITDDPTEIVEIIQRYEDAGLDRLIIGSVCGDPETTIEIFESEIFEHFE